MHPSNTESDIVNSHEEAAGGQPLLEDHSAAFILQQQEEEEGHQELEEEQGQQRETAPDVNSKRLRTYVQVKNPISRRSFQRLIIKQFPSTPMRSSAIKLSRAFNGYVLEDSTGELGIDRLPVYEGNVHTAPGSAWPRCRVRWSARYFVLYRGHWFWFRDRRAYEIGGLEGCLGSVSLMINSLSIELDPRCSTRFSLCVEGWCSILVDTSIQRQDRGAWVLHFLAYANKGDQLRSRFPEVDWEELCRRCRLAVRQANETP
ncbi:uncharacterized protein LOC34619956 [Cyclospora cayetanensis]|uniref:Uncharacterized protein LOC34619956 n=1 Tax=Cyclospora cayetanensis TaxID=88456 RepID=A0A6P6RSZ2_9EIME|nr:uncharacterized protein LOC34619956 [Cyclospora cayetanensis]